jgi:hypothetical protein
MTNDPFHQPDNATPEAEMEALRAAITASLNDGTSIPADEVFDRLEARYLAMWQQQTDAQTAEASPSDDPTTQR